MVTRSLVCQLVETQVVRYLAGDSLSDEALRQLDAHIAGCRECQSFLEAKKAELTGALRPADASPTDPKERVLRAIVDARRVNESGPVAREPLAPVVHPQPKAAPKPARAALVQWKPLVLSAALALVLVAMSALTNNPATVFGRKASEALAAGAANAPVETKSPAEKAPSSPVDPTVEGEPSTEAPETLPYAEGWTPPLTASIPGDPEFVGPAAPAPGLDESAKVEPSPPDTPVPTPTVRAEAPRVVVRSKARATRKRARPAPRPPVAQPTIRVYDPNGRPL
ncbi:MAG: zf-HC2 domain-containing protein [Fimbriimonadaceae bacterium]|nr:zf-HC2 domain-containing protein [Fimbriimonadaceae bacterium]